VLIARHSSPISGHQPLPTGHRYVRLAEDDEQIALAGGLEVLGHVQVGVHACLEDGQAAQLAQVRRLSLVAEGAGDQYSEPRITCLPGRGHQVSALHGAEFGADENGGTPFGGR
jgi:hypothetical protein